MTTPPPAIELVDIHKHFGPVPANRAVNLRVPKGTIHGVVGENGAGKSTLMSILYGYYQADAGHIRRDGRPVSIRSPQDAIRAGIGMVRQHFMLVEPFTVLENIMLGAERGFRLVAGRRAARRELTRLEQDYGLEVDPDAVVGELPVGLQQRVEILKALYRGTQVLILDEPTGVLTPQETDGLFRILQALARQGTTVLLITHKLREILAVTDTVSVMRRGEMVAHRPTADTSREELAELMVGRKVLLRVQRTPAVPGPPRLSVEGLTVTDARGVRRVDDVSFTVHTGEIVGLAGVSGNGQSELLEALAGIRGFEAGHLRLEDMTIGPDTPWDGARMRRAGMALVPEDRLRMGLVRGFSAWESSLLGYQDHPHLNRPWGLQRRLAVDACAKAMAAFDVRPPDPHLGSGQFSGGNQQKLILARELRRRPRVLLVGQPTRGVDIGTIEFIHRELIALRDRGAGLLLVSTDLEEILALSDRILVMLAGRLVGEVAGYRADERSLGLMMTHAPEGL